MGRAASPDGPPADRARDILVGVAQVPAPGHPQATRFLDPDVVAAVVAMPDVVARNHAITHGYHELSEAVVSLLGRTDANWLTFGQWASAEAGRSIRGETIPGLLRPLLADDIAAAVAAGNAAVFGDVAPPFIRFVRAFSSDPGARSDPDRVQALLGDLLADPQLAASDDLRRAFAAYVDVLMTSPIDPTTTRRRAQRMLVANASIGAHEQVVADPFVKAAVPGGSIVAVAATAHLGLQVPEGRLRLDRDVPPPPYLGGASFPPDLAKVEDPELHALAVRFGQDERSSVDSDAPDWEDYRERMGFIFTFLRANQQDPELFGLPPGTPAVEA